MTNEPTFQTPLKSDFGHDLWRGLGLTLALHLLQVPFAIYTRGVSLLLIGITQALYIFPALLVAMLKQRYGIAVGLLIGAGLTMLLSFAVCAVGTIFTIH